ncbi:MAG: hypothetical protein ABI663_09715 [Chryseolinea sp.]
MIENLNYQLGLLHFVHLLVRADGVIVDSERKAILAIKNEEKIQDSVFDDFQARASNITEQEMYTKGIEYLTACTDEERLSAFVHLYKLAQVDSGISNKEVRFLLYGLKVNNLSFEDVILSASMSGM